MGDQCVISSLESEIPVFLEMFFLISHEEILIHLYQSRSRMRWQLRTSFPRSPGDSSRSIVSTVGKRDAINQTPKAKRYPQFKFENFRRKWPRTGKKPNTWSQNIGELSEERNFFPNILDRIQSPRSSTPTHMKSDFHHRSKFMPRSISKIWSNIILPSQAAN